MKNQESRENPMVSKGIFYEDSLAMYSYLIAREQ